MYKDSGVYSILDSTTKDQRKISTLSWAQIQYPNQTNPNLSYQ